MTKTFYCSKCGEDVECECEEYLVGYSDPDKSLMGYFCPLCGKFFVEDEIDSDVIYEQMRDDEMFKKEEEKHGN